jgi:hypothetical protein
MLEYIGPKKKKPGRDDLEDTKSGNHKDREVEMKKAM